MALISKLENIGNAIRNRTGKTDKLTLDQMVSEIDGIKGGSENQPLDITSNGTYTAPEGVGYSPVVVNVPQDGAPTAEELTLTGNCMELFKDGKWDWFIKKYGNQITTKDITRAEKMFYKCRADNIPFEINLDERTSLFDLSEMFYIYGGTNIPKINHPNSKIVLERPAGGIFSYCSYIRYYPEDIDTWFDWSVIDDLTYGNPPGRELVRDNCSLRDATVIIEFLRHSPAHLSGWNTNSYYQTFDRCYALGEIINLPIYTWYEFTSNAFEHCFYNCARLMRLTFDTSWKTGKEIPAKMTNQTINLAEDIGYGAHDGLFTNYNSGLTGDQRVWTEENYQALKNDPDWWTTDPSYSRYNHTSAVETINSLPDTSAYLAEKGGTNTIKFEGRCGSKTDGGAINTLTPEEIAVAAARGWTVTLV